MRKPYKILIPALLILCTLESCATLFGGNVNAYQRTRPADGQPARRVRVGALIADIILFSPSVIVDFATCAIYKPHPKEEDTGTESTKSGNQR